MSQNLIHPTAIIHPKAELDASVEVGPYSVIEENVIIGPGVKIGPHVLIGSGTRIDEKVRIHHGASIGTIPQDLKFRGEESILKIGAETVIREYVTMNRGTEWSGETVVGRNCLLMAYCHVAHDCHIGDHVIMANDVQPGGHVFIEDWAIIGGGVVILQFTKIGCHVIVGGGFRVVQNVCPYAMVGGYPLKVAGLNLVGLKRRGFKSEQLKPMHTAYKLLFFSRLNTTQAIERIKAEVEQTSEVKHILEFIASVEHGIVK